jgi:hypothetical protein
MGTSTSSSTPSKPSNLSEKPGEKTFLRRNRFSKNSYGSKIVKQEQSRNKVQRKYKTYTCGRETTNAMKQEQSTSLQLAKNTCGSSKTIETDKVKCSPISEKQIGESIPTLKTTVATTKIQTPRQTRVSSRSPGSQKSSLIPRGATLFANRYPNVSVNI